MGGGVEVYNGGVVDFIESFVLYNKAKVCLIE
jgi:hypothetical protein